MGCSFTYRHYREILQNALKAGYKTIGFHEAPPREDRILLLRHDVDVVLFKALPLAKLEAELGVRSTYFVLSNSPIYNLFESSSIALVQKIAKLGHWIGLHVDISPDLPLWQIEDHVNSLFGTLKRLLPLTKVVSFHRPSPMVKDRKFRSFVNVYEPRFFSDIKYISDSRQKWLAECPCGVLKERVFPMVQLLTHPIWWWEVEIDIKQIWDRILTVRISEIKNYLTSNISPFKELLEEKSTVAMT